MSKDYSIESIKGIKRKRTESMQGIGSAEAVRGAYQPTAMQAGNQAIQKGDSVQLSDEIKETRSIGGG